MSYRARTILVFVAVVPMLLWSGWLVWGAIFARRQPDSNRIPEPRAMSPMDAQLSEVEKLTKGFDPKEPTIGYDPDYLKSLGEKRTGTK